MSRRAILSDRDGTICEEVGYLTEARRLRLLPGSAVALARARVAGFRTVLVTNQSAVGRGYLTESSLDAIHDLLCERLAEHGAQLDGIYYCPHHPEAADERYRRACDCRKPEPGMLRRAAAELDLDLRSSYIIGDRFDDLAAGARVGATPVLVRTGCGEAELERHRDARAPRPAYVAPGLLEAVEWILDGDDRGRHGRSTER